MSILMSDALIGVIDPATIGCDIDDVVTLMGQSLAIKTIIIDDKMCRVTALANKDLFYSLVENPKQKVKIILNGSQYLIGDIVSHGWDESSGDSCIFLAVRR